MRVTLDMPETMKHYVGKAAELLGIPKMRLITDLGQFGLPHFGMPAGEVLEDAAAARKIAEGRVMKHN